MKPKNLKFPFKWEERQPLILDNVFFVPQHYDTHQDFSFPSFESLFGRDRKVFIEYCSGNGDWIINRALKNPEANWIAVEKRFDRVRKIWSKMRNQNVQNLLIVCGEALIFSKSYLSEGSIAGIFVNFPDPWPKQRQAKHRLIQQPFIGELSRIVHKEGSAFFATDDVPYKDQMLKEMHLSSKWQHLYCTTEEEDYGSSWFERLWKDKGRIIHYLNFKKL